MEGGEGGDEEPSGSDWGKDNDERDRAGMTSDREEKSRAGAWESGEGRCAGAYGEASGGFRNATQWRSVC